MKKIALYGSFPKRNLFVEIIASLLLLFFVYTLISTFINLQSLKNLLAFYTQNETTVASVIIIIEAVITILIFFPRTRLIGFVGAIILIAFAGFTILNYPHYPHDFGGLFNNISRKQKWILISSIGIFCAIGIMLSLLKGKKSVSYAQ